MGVDLRKRVPTKKHVHLSFCTGLQDYIQYGNFSGLAPIEYCPAERFEAKCGESEVILMEKANYGRMRIGKCVKRDFGYLGCQTSVLHYMDSLCSGRRDCSFQIPDQTLRDMRPCSELESYLEASYSCLHGKGFSLYLKNEERACQGI